MSNGSSVYQFCHSCSDLSFAIMKLELDQEQSLHDKVIVATPLEIDCVLLLRGANGL